MPDSLKPRDGKDVEAAVQWALAESKTLEIVGHGSKRAVGRPAQTDLALDLSALSGVTLYEPEELVISAHAGTTLVEIEQSLAQKGQQLAFEQGRARRLEAEVEALRRECALAASRLDSILADS